MPEEEKKTVDIDTSGPDVDVQLPEEKENAENVQTDNERLLTLSSQLVNLLTQLQMWKRKERKKRKEPVQEEKEKELEQYSDSVQRRIAKLTKKWREAERQKDEAS